MTRILVVDDELKMQQVIKDNLELEGYDVDVVGDGKGGLQKLLDNSYSLVLLDVMLPGMSGFDVCRKAREKGIQTPVIFLTAKGEEIDKVLGLELGADDYITKPFGLRELLARTKAVLRRVEGSAGGPAEKMVLGSIEVDFRSYTAVRGGKNVAMTPKEFELLKFLWQHRNQTVSRDQLLTNVWGYDETLSTRTIDNFILKLRQKIEDNPAKPKYIITLHGLGYKLIA
ncbi:MAG TPA: response regulator transcription factor [Bacteroidota bacterium]|nr:response regulator transcription factor [Bacteroidota bacterium]